MKNMNPVFFAEFQLEINTTTLNFGVVAGDNNCLEIFVSEKPIKRRLKNQELNGENAITRKVELQLREYAAGKREHFDLPLKMDGTKFQIKAWKALTRIPFGKTVSYADQSKMIRNPKAVRAVGSANGKNKFPVVVPCHRVIQSSGALGGYSGGLQIKKELLAFEQRISF